MGSSESGLLRQVVSGGNIEIDARLNIETQICTEFGRYQASGFHRFTLTSRQIDGQTALITPL